MAKFGFGKFWNTIAYLLVFLCVAYALVKLFGGEETLLSANLLILAVAVFSYLLSISLWAAAWGNSCGVGFVESQLLTFAATGGAVTPAGVGSDAMRGFFSKRKGNELSGIVASSLAVKLQKIVLTAICAAVFLLAFYSVLDSQIVFLSSIGIAFSLLAVFAIYYASLHQKFISKFIPAKWLSGLIEIGASQFRDYLQRISLQSAILLFLSLCCEFVSFLFCFKAFGAAPALVLAFGAFIVIFFASKIPFLHGLGLIELVGVLLLSDVFSPSKLVAVLFAFDVCRLWLPSLVSLPFIWKASKN